MLDDDVMEPDAPDGANDGVPRTRYAEDADIFAWDLSRERARIVADAVLAAADGMPTVVDVINVHSEG